MKTAIIVFLMSQPVSDFDRELVLATAIVESRCQTHVMGDSGRSWGLFQFGQARWVESGGDRGDWGRATLREQTHAMLRAIDKYKKLMPAGLSRRQQIVWLTNHHNVGHGSLALTPHVVKVLRALPDVAQSLQNDAKPLARTPVSRKQPVSPTKQPRLTAPAR
jgi:hypothetical protein